MTPKLPLMEALLLTMSNYVKSDQNQLLNYRTNNPYPAETKSDRPWPPV